jgi:putative ABC transport system permease protein
MILLYRLAIRLLAPKRMRPHAAGMIETAAQLSNDARARGVGEYFRYWIREFAGLRAWTPSGLRIWTTGGSTTDAKRKALPMLATVWQDVRYSIRLLIRAPGTTAVALLTLALGIGANTAIFSIIDGVLLRPLPYPQADRLYLIQERSATDPDSYSRTNPGTFYDVQQSVKSFDSLTAYQAVTVTLTGHGDPERLDGVLSGGSILNVLGVQPQLGRIFTEEDDRLGAPRTIVISHRLWQRLFAGRPDALGRTLTLAGEPFTLIGIMPQGFVFPDVGPDFWAPMQMPAKLRASRTESFLLIVGRLRQGVTADAARNDLESVMSRLRTEYPVANNNVVLDAQPLHDSAVADVRPQLWILMGGVASVLLIGCANLANLLFARATNRRHEMAIRQAIGAARSRLVRMLLVESLVLALIGGAAGIIAGKFFLNALVAWLPAGIPRLAMVTVDARVLLFTLGVSIATGVLFGLAPAVQTSRGEAAAVLHDNPRTASGRSLVRSSLVVAEIALAVVLLAGAGLLIRSFVRLQQVDPGFAADHVLTFNVRFEGPAYEQEALRVQTVNRMVDQLKQLPGVESAAASSYAPVYGLGTAAWLNIESRPLPTGTTPPGVPYRVITPDYFRVMKIPLVRGRLLADGDGKDRTPSVVISESLARRFWSSPADGDPIGAAIYLGPPENKFARATIVGIVKDVKLSSMSSDLTDAVYGLNTLMTFWRSFTFSIRTAADPRTVASGARRIVRRADPALAITAMQSMTDIVEKSTAPARDSMLLLVLFAFVAVVMAAIGVFGVMSYAVNLRLRELGIRLALGARPSEVQRMVLADGLKQALAGVALGVVGAIWLTRTMRTLLYGVSPGDPLTLVVVAGLLVLTAAAACYLPARRATRIDPLIVLRTG